MRTILILFFSCLIYCVHSSQILTISDSIVDYILHVDEAYISSLSGKKGGSALIDDTQFQEIIRNSNAQPILRPGGSAVNMIKGLQKMGHDCGLISMIGNDDAGNFFLKSLEDQDIRLFLQTSSIPTGKCACLVTQDGERTMRTFLGASKENDNLQLHAEMFEGIDHFHLEGYQLKHRRIVRETLQLAKQNDATISLDLSSFEIVRQNKEFIWELLNERLIDILFANQEEAWSLTELPPKEAADTLSAYCSIAVVTMGENGCFTNQGSQQWQCPAFSVNTIDTIGAGDLFISGFLHGFLTGKPAATCACWGTLFASHVVQVFGAEVPSERWQEIAAKVDRVALSRFMK